MPEPWYVEAFRADYLDIYPHRDLASARAEAAYLVRSGLSGRVLDLGCGFGRHVRALRESGVDALGFDLSLELLLRAEGLGGRLACADARAIPVRDGGVDGVVSLFSSFGYLGEAGDRTVLAEVARVLRPRGALVLDLMNPARVRATLVPRSETRRDGVRVEERRALADGGRRVVKDVVVRGADGRERAWREDVRLYEADDLGALLAGLPLGIELVHGDFDGSPPTPTSSRRILWLRRR